MSYAVGARPSRGRHSGRPCSKSASRSRGSDQASIPRRPVEDHSDAVSSSERRKTRRAVAPGRLSRSRRHKERRIQTAIENPLTSRRTGSISATRLRLALPFESGDDVPIVRISERHWLTRLGTLRYLARRRAHSASPRARAREIRVTATVAGQVPRSGAVASAASRRPVVGAGHRGTGSQGSARVLRRVFLEGGDDRRRVADARAVQLEHRQSPLRGAGREALRGCRAGLGIGTRRSWGMRL